ncbi:Rrf2 family transcriptional regulator [Synechococcus sp. CS-602]|uniref:Rrf2 family transcriptional regulator n=1 Tax=Synechococcus sp. CS-602 TaxID=2847982 RepID=UPI00223B42B4|nr:Rrf2 family transcriptional regulator [Synechococcus sp. CS-602]
MSFSTKTEYPLVALIELADVHSGDGLLQAGEIARRQGIPERYLDQMLTTLAQKLE